MIASNVPVHREKHWPVQVTLADSHGVALPAGHYIAQSYLMTRTDPGTRDPVAFAKKYAASVHFVIEERQPRPREGVVVESLTVPPGGPQGPVRSTEFSMVGAYDVDWLTDPRYRRLLDNLAASPGAVDKVRVFKCLNSGNRESVPPPAATDAVWPLGQASPSFPPTPAPSPTLDGLAEITSRGLIPFVVLGFCPGAVAPTPIDPPTNYANWQTLITAFLNAIASDARLTKVPLLQWWFEVWNEPNFSAFWSGTQTDYFTLYQKTSEAIVQWQTISGITLRLGGRAVIPSSLLSSAGWGIDEFVNFLVANPSVKCDFLSVHQKGAWDTGLNTMPDMQSVVDALDHVGTAAMASPPPRNFNGIAVINNEVDPRANIGQPYPPSMTEKFPAWLTGVLIAYDSLSAQYSSSGYRFFAASDDAHQDLINSGFDNLRSVMTPASASLRDLLKLPVYGYYEPLRLLGDRHGSFISGSNNYYPRTDLFHAITVADTHVCSLWAIHPAHAGDPAPGPWTLDYSIVGIGWPQVNIARFQIDNVLSNSFAAFQKAGATATDIRLAQELTVFAPIQTNVTLAGGTFHDTFTIPPYATMAYWITPYIQDKPADPAWWEAAAEDGNVVLRWKPNVEPWFYRYEVSVMRGDGPGVVISPAVLRAAMWVHTQPEPGTYVYQVRAISASGVSSASVTSGTVTI
jgi:hypothetical protein